MFTDLEDYEGKANSYCKFPSEHSYSTVTQSDNLNGAKAECNKLEDCNMFYYDGYYKKYYICPDGSESIIGKSSVGSVLYIKGTRIYYLSSRITDTCYPLRVCGGLLSAFLFSFGNG